MTKRYPDPSEPVADWMLSGFTFGERAEIRRRRKAWLAQNREKLEAEKKRTARTCQICGRPIHAETGVIAHHGYTRPYPGVQTNSCFGARHPSWERSRDCLGEWIAMVTRWRDLAFAAAKATREETQPAYYGVRYYSRGHVLADKSGYVTQSFPVTRETFAWVQGIALARIHAILPYRPEEYLKTFETVRDETAAGYDRDGERWEIERKHCQERYDSWVQLEGDDGQPL